jgi:hypothetical protein
MEVGEDNAAEAVIETPRWIWMNLVSDSRGLLLF